MKRDNFLKAACAKSLRLWAHECGALLVGSVLLGGGLGDRLLGTGLARLALCVGFVEVERGLRIGECLLEVAQPQSALRTVP